MTDGCELPCGYWDANLSLLSGRASSGLGVQGQLLASTAASSFSLPSAFWAVATPLPCPSQETGAGTWKTTPIFLALA